MVSIAAFQAVDPGSIPGHRSGDSVEAGKGSGLSSFRLSVVAAAYWTLGVQSCKVASGTCCLLSPWQAAIEEADDVCSCMLTKLRCDEWHSAQRLVSLLTSLIEAFLPKVRYIEILSALQPLRSCDGRGGLESRGWGCCGRVVKAMDLKSIGVSPRRFESCQQCSL